MPTITIQKDVQKPFSVFATAKSIAEKAKDHAGDTTTFVLAGFNEQQAGAVATVFLTASLMAIGQSPAAAQLATQRTSHANKLETDTTIKSMDVVLGKLGTVHVERNTENETTTISLPNFDEGALPAYQIGQNIDLFKNTVTRGDPPLVELSGIRYRAFSFPDTTNMEVGFAILKNLSYAHGHDKPADLATVSEGLRFSNGQNYPSVLVLETAYQAIKKAELSSSPPLPPK